MSDLNEENSIGGLNGRSDGKFKLRQQLEVAAEIKATVGDGKLKLRKQWKMATEIKAAVEDSN